MTTPSMKQPTGNIGQRIFAGLMGTFNNAGGQTFHIATALDQPFVAVRPIFANTSGVLAPYCTGVIATALASTADLNGSSNTWVTGTQNGQVTFGLAVAPNNTGQRISYTVTDWIPVASVPRTDGGTLPLIAIRAYFPDANATFPVYGNGINNLTNWVTKPDGRIWCARNQLVSGVSAPTTFTSVTNQSQSAIVGVQYLTVSGSVVNVMGIGDSITEGFGGTYIGESFIGMAAEAASNPVSGGVAVQYSDCGWIGQPQGSVSNGFGFATRLIDILNSPVRPDIVIFPNASPNDITGSPTTITPTLIESLGLNLGSMLAECKARDVSAIVWTWLPSNTSQKTYGTSDALRVAYNEVTMALSNTNVIVNDLSTPASGAPDVTGQIQFATGFSTDGLHPNQFGNTSLSGLLFASLTQLIEGIA